MLYFIKDSSGKFHRSRADGMIIVFESKEQAAHCRDTLNEARTGGTASWCLFQFDPYQLTQTYG